MTSDRFNIIRCVDVETTGEDPAKDGAEVCEIGWCDLVRVRPGTADSDVNVYSKSPWTMKKPQGLLVKPTKLIPPQMSAIHHITNDDVDGEPPFSVVAQALFKDASDVILCAHNARFEQKFITTPATWICTYKLAVMLAPNAPNHKLQTLRYWLKLEVDKEYARDPHRAPSDAYVAACLLKRILDSGKMTLDQMIDISSRPIILPKLHFGKHEGQPIDEIPTQYLKWILDEEKHEPFDEDTVATARHYIKERQNQRSLDV